MPLRHLGGKDAAQKYYALRFDPVQSVAIQGPNDEFADILLILLILSMLADGMKSLQASLSYFLDYEMPNSRQMPTCRRIIGTSID